MLRFAIGIGLGAVALIVSACGNAGTARTLTEADNLSEVLLDSGDEFEIRLESNATTGFEWMIDEDSLPETIELIDDRYEAPDTDLVGAPGTQVYMFEATEDGAGILRLEYVRLFEDPIIPERVIEYIIRVDKAPWPPEDPGTPPGTSTATAP
jgi:predicted secreted protein